MRRTRLGPGLGAGLFLGIALALTAGCSLPSSPEERCSPDCPPPRLPHPLY